MDKVIEPSMLFPAGNLYPVSVVSVDNGTFDTIGWEAQSNVCRSERLHNGVLQFKKRLVF